MTLHSTKKPLPIKKRVLIIHQNFPGQFKHIAGVLRDRPDVELVGIGKTIAPGMPGVHWVRYKTHRNGSQGIHPYCRNMEAAVLHGQAIVKVLLELKASGFEPDVVLARYRHQKRRLQRGGERCRLEPGRRADAEERRALQLHAAGDAIRLGSALSDERLVGSSSCGVAPSLQLFIQSLR